LVFCALALRLFLIFPGPLESRVEALTNKADLRNYYWPAQAALKGENPYVLWAEGKSGEFRADMAPLELLVYVGAVAVWDDPRALQVLFALCDALNIALLGVLLKQSRLRLPFQIFYAVGPLTLYNLVLVPQDKTILLTLTFVVFYLLIQINGARTAPHASRFTFHALMVVIAAALVASFKWLSVFYILPLLLYIADNPRAFFKYAALFGAIIALAHLPWMPSWSVVYAFRSGRVGGAGHISLGVLLREVGAVDARLLIVGLIVSLAITYVLFWCKRLDIFETIALSAGAGILWTPDMDPVHLSIVVLYLLLIFDWSAWGRQAMVWGLGLLSAAVYLFSTRAGFTRYGIPDLRALTGAYGSVPMILLSYILFMVVLGFYLYDKLKKRAVGGQAFAHYHLPIP
jgi:hypothetical protein